MQLFSELHLVSIIFFSFIVYFKFSLSVITSAGFGDLDGGGTESFIPMQSELFVTILFSDEECCTYIFTVIIRQEKY